MLISSLADVIKKESITAVVVGDSRNARGEDNSIMTKIKQFAEDIKRETGVMVHFEPEFYTSVEARRDTGKHLVDAEAATIILNSYITRTAQ